MKPKQGFKLNVHRRAENPCFESHDPSMMWDRKSGYYYSYCTDASITSEYRQGIPVRRSRDLVEFEFVGYALSQKSVEQGRCNGEYPPTKGFWAPYVEYCRGEYRMYYSATKAFGSSESRIWLAVAARPEGPFENRGIVMDTWNTPNTGPNAIDPHVADDEEGRKYMIYGSYFGGIYMKELEPESGMPVVPNVNYRGKQIARKPENAHVDGPEGAAVIYAGETGYYYLFLSYGWLGDTYDIRAGRSRNPWGPFLDYNGRDLNGESLGIKLAGSYCFESLNLDAGGDEPGWRFAGFRGPGHGVPFYDMNEKNYFFIHHMRDGADVLSGKGPGGLASYRMHYLVVRRMYFLEGWPALSPEPYAGESGSVWEILPYRENETESEDKWEWLELSYLNNEIVYGKRAPLPLNIKKAIAFDCFDYENNCQCIGLCGLTEQGQIIWGKRYETNK